MGRQCFSGAGWSGPSALSIDLHASYTPPPPPPLLKTLKTPFHQPHEGKYQLYLQFAKILQFAENNAQSWKPKKTLPEAQPTQTEVISIIAI